MEKKSFPVWVLNADDSTGIVEAYVAVMGNIDRGNDRIWQGAFTKTLLESFGQVVVLDNHNNDSTEDVIGLPLEAKEVKRNELPLEMLAEYPTATGALYTKTQYLLDTIKGSEIFKRIKAKAIRQYSIGFKIPKGKFDYTNETIDGVKKQIRNIREIALYEWSPVIWAQNDATSTIGFKNMNETKSISLSKYMDKLRSSFEQSYLVEVEEGEYKYTTVQFWITEIFEDHIYVCPSYYFKGDYDFGYYKVFYQYDEQTDTFSFDPQDKWIGGSYQFVAGVKSADLDLEIKAGRVLSSSNMDLVMQAINALKAVYDAANKTVDNEEYNNEDANKSDSEEKADTDTPITLEARQLLVKKIELELLQL